MPDKITLYLTKRSVYAHRATLALAEAKVDYTRFEVDMVNKPEWYTSKVNPAGKVPALAHGGPQVSPDQPSPESFKLAESLIIVEFIADLYPKAKIMPTDPVQRAKVRFFIDAVTTKFAPAYVGLLLRGEPFDPVWAALDVLQALLPEDKPYAIGDEYTAADIALIPFLARLELVLGHDIGAYKPGEGRKAAQYLLSDKRFARIVKYLEMGKARESFRATYDAEYLKDAYGILFGAMRAKVQGAAA
ncbi:thioredoxin-like protein [Mycena belliarum]|uniref:Thioredoxin-like protein n=1 Tax=Mycena belliarum TaxID=1033014 RepID=A0AAD6XWR4_9AGAR|nr:thioredoxin-like protein [Mycena belliae]